MAVSVNTNFHVNTALPVDTRFVLSKEQMLNANPDITPDVYFCVCSDDGQFYLYNKDNVENAETGKYEKLASSGVDDTDIWKESTEYVVGKIVKYNGKKYQCITLHTSSTVFEDDGANWIELVETYALLTKAQHDYLVENNLIEDKIYVKVDDVSEGDLVDFDGIIIKEFDTTVEYQVGEYVVYNNVIYKANTITTNVTEGTFVESEWDLIGGGDIIDIVTILDATSTDDQVPSAKVVYDKLQEVFQSSNDTQNAYETAIIGKGGTVSKASNVATKREILDGIESISVGEDIAPIHDTMTDLGYNATNLTNLSIDKTAHIISKCFVLKTATDNIDTILDVANTDTFTDWMTDDEITDFGDYINPTYSSTQLSVSEDADSGLFISEELAVHELYTINKGGVD